VREDLFHDFRLHFFTEDFVTSRTMNAAFQIRDAERSAFAAGVLRRSGRLRLQVHGESMLPTLGPRDVVEIASCTVDDLRPGDIVLAEREGRFFLRRFVSRHPKGFLLRGDSMPAHDLPFTVDALLGRLRAPALPLRPWTRLVGLLACYCTPVRRLLLTLRNLGRRQRQRILL